MADFDIFAASQPAAGNGSLGGSEEDPAAAFLAQQENEIAGIENDEGYNILENGEVPPGMQGQEGLAADSIDGVTNGDLYQESNGPTDCYAAISQADRLQTEPESIRKWREEQQERLEVLDANSRKQEAEWKEKAIKELEEWYERQDEQLEKTKVNNRIRMFIKAAEVASARASNLSPWTIIMSGFRRLRTSGSLTKARPTDSTMDASSSPLTIVCNLVWMSKSSCSIIRNEEQGKTWKHRLQHF
uniref:Clathrin light chain n=1 Tax=Anolis carolinensis TaxID=28377 RepID=A0A803TQ48_ANOCA